MAMSRLRLQATRFKGISRHFDAFLIISLGLCRIVWGFKALTFTRASDLWPFKLQPGVAGRGRAVLEEVRDV